MQFVLIVLIVITISVSAKEWWENAQLYQIYPRSFKDSNGDGVGDLKGITEKLDHFTDAGVQGIWLSPIYASPMVDFGYDISDFTAINPEYGTMADFEELQAKCKKLGIKLILDFVPNHTSDDHEWFKKSAARVSGYEDYYIWADGVQDPQNASKLLPPSNWISIFYGSAWTWHEGRKQFYFHTFHVRQPDINYRDPGLVEDMKEVLRFWLNKGVHGFRVDAIPFLFEVDKNKFGGKYPDEPLSGMTDDPNDYNHLLHPHTKDQPETYEMVMQWRAVLDDYSEKNDKSVRILMMEAYTTIEEQMKYYGNVTHPGAQFPFNFNFITDLNKGSDANDIDRAVHSFADKLGPGFHGANWVIGNHDNSRVTTRYGEERVDGISMIINLLPGVGVTYQGDELAMEDQFLTWEQTKDPQACNTNPDVYAQMSRDPARTPFQWDASANAGFSTSNLTWLPVATNYKTLNLKAQIDAPRSHFKTYQALSKLRREFTIMHGDLNTHVHNDATVFSFKRSLTGFPDYVVIANIRNTTANLSLKNPYPSLKTEVIVVVSSLKSSRNIGDMVNSANLTLDPYEALVLKSD